MPHFVYNILQNKLGPNYKILQEGLPGRIAGSDEKEKIYKNGKDTFISIFRTNAPVDILIISLGTNDLQFKYNKNSKDIIKDLLWYKEVLEEMILDQDDKMNTIFKQIYIIKIYISNTIIIKKFNYFLSFYFFFFIKNNTCITFIIKITW